MRGAPSLAIPLEIGRLGKAWLKYGVLGLPYKYSRSIWKDPAIDGPLSESRILDLFGENIIDLFDELGPIYGKAGQMLLSRLSPPMHEVAEALRLTRLYKDWPPIAFAEIEEILDQEIPRWRTELTVEPHPLGVASLAQVHGAVDRQGRRWVIKIVKPQARKRLLESVSAIESLAAYVEPLAVTLVSKRLLREMRELCLGFRRELDLARERETIVRVSEKLKKRRQRLLIVPEVHADYSTEKVLVVERFDGVSLADVVNGDQELPAKHKAKLARTMLHELLVQVFELGLFHADPHAGNLILMDSGSVGLFDWGLAGELMESDRRHIAAILKSVIALDRDQLTDALIAMAAEEGKVVERSVVEKELKKVMQLFREGQSEGGKRPSLQQMFEACLKGAARLGIPVPEGLLMMVKSLITIEGLARGIDPKVSMARVATPVLFRAAKPGVRDLLAMGRRLPQFAKTFFGSPAAEKKTDKNAKADLDGDQ